MVLEAKEELTAAPDGGGSAGGSSVLPPASAFSSSSSNIRYGILVDQYFQRYDKREYLIPQHQNTYTPNPLHLVS